MNRSRLSKNVYLIIFFILIFTLSACSSSPKASNGESASAKPTDNNTATAKNSASSNAPDPFGKYDPPIEITSVKLVDGDTKFDPNNPDYKSIDENVINRNYEEKLGVKVKYLWTAPTDQYFNKLNVSIASNDIPDIFHVNSQQFKMLLDAGQLEDLTDVLKQYASPAYKRYLELDNGYASGFSTVNGKMYALPLTGGVPDGAAVIYLRYDWLTKLGLSEPKTMDDVLKIADAFAHQDPDGNGKNDTYGLAAQKDVGSGFADLGGFLNAYHAYWDIWMEGANGSLVYSSILPENKPALLKLQELYKKGVLDKEFAVKDISKEGELVANGKIGLTYGVFWAPNFKIIDNIKADPKADWRVYSAVSADDKPLKLQAWSMYDDFVVVKKGYKHPEAAVKLANVKVQDYVQSDYIKFQNPKNDAIPYFKYFIVNPEEPWANLNNHLAVMKGIKTGDTSKFTDAQKNLFDQLAKYKAGDRSQSNNNLVAGEQSAFSIVNTYKDNNMVITTKVPGYQSPAMIQKWQNLVNKTKEAYLKIIMGADISEFDKFVEEWKKQGGDTVTKELNDWYSAKK